VIHGVKPVGEPAIDLSQWSPRIDAAPCCRFTTIDPTPDRVSLGEYCATIAPSLVDQTLTAAGGFAAAGALLLVIARWRP